MIRRKLLLSETPTISYVLRVSDDELMKPLIGSIQLLLLRQGLLIFFSLFDDKNAVLGVAIALLCNTVKKDRTFAIWSIKSVFKEVLFPATGNRIHINVDWTLTFKFNCKKTKPFYLRFVKRFHAALLIQGMICTFSIHTFLLI